MQKDTPLVYEYAGQVMLKNEVKVQARVSGNIVEKYKACGEMVRKGTTYLESIRVNMKVLYYQLKLN